MRFKHTVHVLIDNFRTTFKLLIYLLVILAISAGLYAAVVIPFLNNLSNQDTYIALKDAISALIGDVSDGDLTNLPEQIKSIGDSFSALLEYLSSMPSSFALCIVGLLAVTLIRRFLIGFGNYAASAVINDRMAMQANSPFLATLIKNLGKASLYNVIYVPLSLIYDALCTVGLYFLLFVALGSLPLFVKFFLFAVFMILLQAIKMMFTTDWLPAIIAGKKKVTDAMKYSFSRKNKLSGQVYSFFATSCVLILAVNVLGAISTFGAALIITLPLSYLYLLCYEFVNYSDNNRIKYFIDKRTIIKPENEEQTSRDKFLRGE